MPRRSIRRLGIIMMLALASVPLAPVPHADATVVIPVTLQELAATADAIARGRIVRIDARQTSSRRVERVITFEPIEHLKGQLGGLVQFRLPGGTFGRYRTIAVGAPEFKEGDEVVLFLGQRPDAPPVLLGFHQGVYRIAFNAAGERVVTPPVLQELPSPAASSQAARPSAARAAASDDAGTPIVRGDLARRPLPWNQFHAQVMAAIAAAPAVAQRGRP